MFFLLSMLMSAFNLKKLIVVGVFSQTSNAKLVGVILAYEIRDSVA